MTDHDPIAVARLSYRAYVEKDRALLESIVADDFRFTSPLDNALDRATYFARCWPNSEWISAIDIVSIARDGERVFLTYEGKSTRGPGFRNTEVLTVRSGKLVAAEVYFGWSLPHEAPVGSFKK